MRAREFIVEDNESRTEEFHGVHMKLRDDGYEVVASALDDWGREMGSVVFNKGDGNELDPQDLLVIDKFRGQGIAKVMYDYVKSKGYEIHKSYDVTKIADQGKESGEYFWQKNRGEERVWEAFDKPYKMKWEKSDYGDIDVLAKLPDGTYLNIMFNQGYDGDDVLGYNVEFYRNNSQEVTGEGDAYNILATVLASIQKFVKKYKPESIRFSANKEPEVDVTKPGAKVNPESRAKLYNRMVHRYAGAMGYNVKQQEGHGFVWYTLRRAEQGVAEGEDKSKDLIANAILDFYQHAGHISKEPVDNYVGTAKEMLGQVSDPKIKSKILDIFKQAKQSPYVQGGVVTTIGALLAGGVLSSAQKMGLSPAQTNLALQAILNTVIPTVVSRINGKSWSDTIKYTLASAGIGTGIAGMMEE
jgi:GNAT superfamily N-acetyltransferase